MVSTGGSGERLGQAVIIVAGVLAWAAAITSLIAVWFQIKRYIRLQQRFVVRILLLVPIYAIASWVSLLSFSMATWIDPLKEIYEAFVIYCFFNLLVDHLGGERSLITMIHGRSPVRQPWPLHRLPKVDLSDPHHFLALKRGILQYTWLKPLLAVATFVMKSTDTFQEGYISLKSGYFWSGLVYNCSVSVSLYSLALFWVCTSDDLQDFRPWPKFLTIKLVIFASYWQGFFLAILQYFNILHDAGHYTQANLALAIQDVLICFEMPFFAVAQWYAFGVQDYYPPAHISCARMTAKYAFRDAFGIADLVADNLWAVQGDRYDYQQFESGEPGLPPEERARWVRLRAGMRYEHGGKGKYWIPKPVNARTGLLSGITAPSYVRVSNDDMQNIRNHAMMRSNSETAALESIKFEIDPDDEALFANASKLEFGDYNYPVIPVKEPYIHYDVTVAHSSQGSSRLVSAIRRQPKNPARRMGLGRDRGQSSRVPPVRSSLDYDNQTDFDSNREGIISHERQAIEVQKHKEPSSESSGTVPLA